MSTALLLADAIAAATEPSSTVLSLVIAILVVTGSTLLFVATTMIRVGKITQRADTDHSTIEAHEKKHAEHDKVHNDHHTRLRVLEHETGVLPRGEPTGRHPAHE